jgi:hypothetical protein
MLRLGPPPVPQGTRAWRRGAGCAGRAGFMVGVGTMMPVCTMLALQATAPKTLWPIREAGGGHPNRQTLGRHGRDGHADRHHGHGGPALIVQGVTDATGDARRIVSDGSDRPRGDAEMAAEIGAPPCGWRQRLRPGHLLDGSDSGARHGGARSAPRHRQSHSRVRAFANRPRRGGMAGSGNPACRAPARLHLAPGNRP